MPYISIDDFRLGMDTRKPRVTGEPGSLTSLKNGHLTRGGHIQRSKKFVSTYTLPVVAASTEATATFSVTAGTAGALTSLTIDSVELLGSSVSAGASETATATLIAAEINANTALGLSHGYSASASSVRVTITAPIGTGASENGNTFAYTATGGLTISGDAYWSDTVLLVHANGIDAATSTTDNSSVGRALTFANDAQLDTAQKKWGLSSLLFDGVNDYISAPLSTDFDFGADPFTVECWVRFSSVASTQAFVNVWHGSNTDLSWTFIWNTVPTPDKLVFVISTDGTNEINAVYETWAPSTNTWYHIAATRDSDDDWRVFVDGTRLGSGATNNTSVIKAATQPLYAGSQNNLADLPTNDLDGWLDDIRVTKGAARYTSDFTVPCEQFDIADTVSGLCMQGGVTTDEKTFSLHRQGDNLYVFGGFAEPGGMPSGVLYQRLAHKTTPDSTQVARILDAENFDGKIYAIAEYTDGAIYHFYDGARVTAWDDISASISSNDTVATSLKNKIDLSVDFDATVVTDTITIEAAVAGTGFTIAATAQNFGTVNDQVITLAQTVANDAGGAEVLATGTLTVTGGLHDVASEGSVNLDSGGAGSVDGITVDGVEIMSGAESFDGNLSTTATNVAANITAHTSVPDYDAAAVGALITITADHDAGADPNGFAVVSSTTTISTTDVNMGGVTAGVTNALTMLSVDGVNIITDRVDHEESNSLTATQVAIEINNTTSSPDYDAASVGSVVTITAKAGTGAGPNGFTVARTVVGDFTAGVTDMQGGAASSSTAKEKWTAQIGGTFEAVDIFTITLNGKDYVVQGAASGTGTSLLTWKKKLYTVAASLMYFSAINNPTAWEQISGNTSTIGAGFINFSNQDSGSETLTGMGVYQGNIAVFADGVTQIEFVDVDEDANTLLHTVGNTGTEAHRSIVPFGNTDLFYLDSANGLRSMRARDSSNAPEADDVGTPIDEHLLAYLGTLTAQEAVDAIGLIGPDGRYWLALKGRIYIFSYFRASKISAWSYYEPSVGDIGALVRRGKDIYLRSGETIYQYGGSARITYPSAGETPLVIELPFIDLDKAAHQKTLEAFDFAAVNTFDCNILINPNDETVMSETFTLSGVTYPNGRVGDMSLKSSHFAPKLVCDQAGNAELHNLAIHYSLGEAA